ncbi:bcl-2-related protein A1-like [Lepus europaeus]|uniref:bcl-2-related protein A1-like n=1 Tax=Lepus europaeus TaxID=9983 RepID=UPI002B4651BE|nr:bcl-2-related protein A1-like [Lepus europaeus]
MSDCEFAYVHMLADYLLYILKTPQPGLGLSKTSRVLQNVTFSIQQEVEEALQPYLHNVPVASVKTARMIFNQVMEKKFEDGVVNWGRIVTIFAFEGVLAKKLLREQAAPDVDIFKPIPYFVAEFTTRRMGEWIKSIVGVPEGMDAADRLSRKHRPRRTRGEGS